MKKLQLLALSMLLATGVIINTADQGQSAPLSSPQAAKFAAMQPQEKKAMLQKMSLEERAAFKAQLTPEQQEKLAAQQQKQKQMPRRMARRQARRSGN